MHLTLIVLGGKSNLLNFRKNQETVLIALEGLEGKMIDKKWKFIKVLESDNCGQMYSFFDNKTRGKSPPPPYY